MSDSIEQALASARVLLKNSNTASLDAEVLLASVLDATRTYLRTWPENKLTSEQSSRYRDLLEKRAKGEPVAYLTAVQEFWSLTLTVDQHTLIPRPETEILVEKALQLVPDEENWNIADLGTGSGAIGLALAKERPHCHLVLTDVSANALKVATQNRERLKLENVSFKSGSWLTPLAGRKFDMIVSNPPYIAENDPHLDRGDVRYEPDSALRAGEQGLDALNSIIDTARYHLVSGGYLLLEHGYDQEQAVLELFEVAGYHDVSCVRDYANQARVSFGTWVPSN